MIKACIYKGLGLKILAGHCEFYQVLIHKKLFNKNYLTISILMCMEYYVKITSCDFYFIAIVIVGSLKLLVTCNTTLNIYKCKVPSNQFLEFAI